MSTLKRPLLLLISSLQGVVLIALCLPFLCLAQDNTASVLGTIFDATGAAIPRATVALQNLDTGVKANATSGENGLFTFLSVKIGRYSLNATAPGFKTTETEPFPVTVNARQRVDVKLVTGDVHEIVTVRDAATLLETESSERGYQVGRNAIVNLPLNGRDYTDLALLVPGVRRSNNQAAENIEGALNINGLPSFFNNFILDGVDNNSYAVAKLGYSAQVIVPSPDAIEEFRVQTDNYSAEFGHSAGGIINVAIRSGTNQIHGSLSEYLRNTALNAVGFFKPSTGKPTLIQNQFGATLGGPLQKNKLFLFGNYEGFRKTQVVVQFATIADLTQRRGIFPGPVKNPYTGTVYSDGVIPGSALSPFGLKVLSLLPAPNNPGTSNFVGLAKTPTNNDKGDIRSDYYINDKLNIFGRYSRSLYSQTAGTTLTGPNAIPNIIRTANYQIIAGGNWVISPTSLLDFRMGITLSEGSSIPTTLGEPGMDKLYGITGLPTDPTLSGGLTPQSISGYAGLGRDGSRPQHSDPFVVNPKLNYSWHLARHSLKAGYEFLTIRTAVGGTSNGYGADSYSGQFSRPSTVASNSVYNLADFLFGARSSYSLGTPTVDNYRQEMHFGYVQDDFSALPNLTLNLGLRYEFATPQYERDDKLSNFDPVTQTLVRATGGSLLNRALINPDYKDFEPRAGLAWTFAPKTVLRAGYGISHVHFNRSGSDGLLGGNPPLVALNTYNQTPALGICASSASPGIGCFRPTDLGYPKEFSEPANFNTLATSLVYIPTDIKTTNVQSWHISVQRELARDLLLDVGYVGNHGVGLWVLGDYNQANPNKSGQSLALQNRRPLPNYSQIGIIFSGSGSTYNALVAKVEKRYSHGLYFIHSFTWSKAIDNAPGHQEVSNGDDKGVNYRDLRSAKGVSNYDQPFQNTTTVIWAIPALKLNGKSAFNAFSKVALQGWRLSVINSALGGQPVNFSYSPTSAFQVSTISGLVYRPNILGDPMLPASQRSAQRYFNLANLQIPTDVSQPFGNAGRNIARSPGLNQLDLGLHKTFALPWDRTQLEFRAEGFNVLNRTNFKAPNANISSSAFGTTTSSFPARQMQFALRLFF